MADTECYSVIVGGMPPRYYPTLKTAKRVASWYRNRGYGRGTSQPEPVIKKFILAWTVED